MKQFVVAQPMAFEKVIGPRIPGTTVRDSLYIQVCDDVVELLVGQTLCGTQLERRYEFFLEVAWRDTISLMYLEVHQTSLVIPDDTNKTIVDFFGFAECLANDEEREARHNSSCNLEPAVLVRGLSLSQVGGSLRVVLCILSRDAIGASCGCFLCILRPIRGEHKVIGKRVTECRGMHFIQAELAGWQAVIGTECKHVNKHFQGGGWTFVTFMCISVDLPATFASSLQRRWRWRVQFSLAKPRR
jgi:hypothetical protein